MAEYGDGGAVPPEVIRVDSDGSKLVGDKGLNPDKNATPSEPHAEADVALKHLRPQIIASQRHSDTDRCPNDSQAKVFEQLRCVEIRSGSTALDQFKCDYLPRTFPFVYPHHVGAPDFDRHYSRRVEERRLPPVLLEKYARFMARRVEYQVRSDWQYLGGLWNLLFKTLVNRAPILSFQFTPPGVQNVQLVG